MKISNNLQFHTEDHSSPAFKVLVYLIILPRNCSIKWNNAVSVYSIPLYTACFITLSLCLFFFYFYFSPNLSRNSSSKCLFLFFFWSNDFVCCCWFCFVFLFVCFVGMHNIYPTSKLFSWYWRIILLSIYQYLWNCSISLEPIIQSQFTSTDLGCTLFTASRWLIASLKFLIYQ